MATPPQPRLDAHPLIAALPGGTINAKAVNAGVDSSLLCRARREGITLWSADRIATAAGLHIDIIYPDIAEQHAQWAC